MAAIGLDLKSPRAEPVGLFCDLGSAKDRASAMGVQHANVFITVFGYASEATDVSAGTFFGDESEVAGEVTARAEAFEIANESHESGRSEKANSRDGEKSLHGWVLIGEGLELRFVAFHTCLELADFRAGFVEVGSQSIGKSRFCVFDEPVDLRHDMVGSLGNEEAELS